jgi:peroxiredoxin
MRTLLSKAFVALLCAAPLANAAPDRAGDFALLDTSGEFHQLSRYRHKEALVLMAFDANCAAMPAAINELKARNEVWQEQDVAFALINAAANQDLNKLREQRAALGIDLPVLIDKGQLVSETMDLRHAGEVVVLDP